MPENRKTTYVELNMNVPLHQEAFSFLQKYQKQTRFSKKDALIQHLRDAKKREAAKQPGETDKEKELRRLMSGDY